MRPAEEGQTYGAVGGGQGDGKIEDSPVSGGDGLRVCGPSFLNPPRSAIANSTGTRISVFRTDSLPRVGNPGPSLPNRREYDGAWENVSGPLLTP